MDCVTYTSSSNNRIKKTSSNMLPYLIKYTVIPSIFLSFIAIIAVNPNVWVTSDVHHFYFEMFAVVLSAIVAFYCLARAYTMKEKFSLFVGIGFLTITIIDLLHAVLSFSSEGDSVFLAYFIPQTWFAGRTFLGAMLAIAVIKYTPPLSDLITITATNPRPTIEPSISIIDKDFKDTEQEEENATFVPVHKDGKADKLHSTILYSLILLSVLAISVVVFSFFTIFPGIVLADYLVHRPYEVPSLILFSLALVYFYKKKIYKSNDFFYKGILGALVIDIFGQIIMSFSSVNFNTAHNIAHILKDSGYFIIVISLALSSIQYTKIAREREQVIRAQYDELKEADKMKDEFINIAAHELRTPIQPILGLSEIIRPKVNPEEREYMDVITRNAKRLRQLTEDILDATRINSHSLKLNIEEFNLNDVLVHCINDMIINKYFSNNEKEEENLKILYDPKDVFVDADRTRVTQVVSNLLSNARKFTKEGGVSISSGLNDNHNEAVICIKDTGRGIDSDIMPRLFTRFASKSFQGTGLGLFISKSIIEAHGGRIWAENNADGKGAAFYFTLPLQRRDTIPQTISTPSQWSVESKEYYNLKKSENM
jgi:signal transduction histidine kinase